MINCSIITPSYKRAKFLATLHKNLKNFLEHYNCEWIICLEKNDFKSINYVKKIKSKRVKFVVGKFNSGANAFNSGLKIAKGRYVNYHGDDDLKNENFFSILENLPTDYKIFSGKCVYVDNNVNPIRKLSTSIKNLLSKNQNYFNTKCVNHLMTPAIIVEKNLVIKNKGLDNKFKYANDYVLWLRILATNKLKFINLTTTYARYSSETQSGKFRLDRFKEIYKINLDFNKGEIAYFVNCICLFFIIIYNLKKIKFL